MQILRLFIEPEAIQTRLTEVKSPAFDKKSNEAAMGDDKYILVRL